MFRNLLMCGVLVSLGAAAQAQAQYEFRHEFRAGIAEDGATTVATGVGIAPSGDLYWITFAAEDSQLIHAANAVSAMTAGTTPTRSIVLTERTAPDAKAIETGRGYNDLEVDSNGNVYVVGGGGSAATTVLRKVGPAPSHTVAWTAEPANRYQGVAKVSADKLIATGFNYLAEVNDADGTNGVLPDTTGTLYQRAVAFNPLNNDLYVSRNGSGNGHALNVYSGGSPSSPGSYVLTQANAVLYIGLNTTYGVPTQSVDFDSVNSELVMADHPAPGYHIATGVRIYKASGSGASASFTEQQYLDGTETSSGVGFSDVYGVAHRRVDGKDYIAAAAGRPDGFYIVLYERVAPPTSVKDWSLYQ